MEDNTENNSQWTDAKINCLFCGLTVLLFGGEIYISISHASALKSGAHKVTNANVVTTATHTDRLVMSRHTNLIRSTVWTVYDKDLI